ncbi:MAG: putative DNA-binding domain-containing protein [Woeseiaceae bacterium]|nr:putative DNA-binding domain-containing protein [Woeseiaceae bacterium]
MPDEPAFKAKQYEFAAHVGDPDRHAAPPGVEDRRMAVYRDLFFNNLFKLLGSTFPVLRKLYGDRGWRRLVRAFMSGYRSQTPYFLEIPREFVTFLQTGYEPLEDDPPFLLELAHYEWAELALSVSDASNDMTGIDPDGDLLDGVPVGAELAWPLAYRYPVHRISMSFRPAEPPAEHYPAWSSIAMAMTSWASRS